MKTAKLSSLMEGRENHCNLSRFIAAFFVMCFHSYILLGDTSGLAKPFNLGALGVNIFFIISGLLITKSYIHASTLQQFYIARFLRIWPALLLNAFFCVFVIGLILTPNPTLAYFKKGLYYIYQNMLVHNPHRLRLPGCRNDFSLNFINASLWTLEYELFMYALLAFLFKLGCGSKRHIFLFLLIYLLAINFMVLNSTLLVGAKLETILRFSCLFFLGATAYLFKERLLLSKQRLLIALILFLISLLLPSSRLRLDSLQYLLLAIIIIHLVFLPKGKLLAFNRLGDYSYGLYLYAWPIGLLLSTRIRSYVPLCLSTLILALACAIASWHLIENKALKLKKELLCNKSRSLSTGANLLYASATLFLLAMPVL